MSHSNILSRVIVKGITAVLRAETVLAALMLQYDGIGAHPHPADRVLFPFRASGGVFVGATPAGSAPLPVVVLMAAMTAAGTAAAESADEENNRGRYHQ